MPGHVRKVLLLDRPGLSMLLRGLLAIAIVPFGSRSSGTKTMVIAEPECRRILYTFGIVSLSVYGIVLAGYASNSKYPFLGGIRSSAQMISYEVAMGLSVIPVFLLGGQISTCG